MSLFKKLFGSETEPKEEETKSEYFTPENSNLPTDELFTLNYKKNGGKFIYCENLDEVREQFENILEENDWFEKDVLCFEDKIKVLLDENKLPHIGIGDPVFFFGSCENLIAEEGAVLFSSNQIKHYKPSELPTNIVILATTSQILNNKNDGMRMIKQKYISHYPSNITSIKYFEKSQNDDFLTHGSSPKNIYLLLLEDM